MVFLFLTPLVTSILFSFSKMDLASKANGYALDFVGWENYKTALFLNQFFKKNLITSFVQMLTQVPVIVVFSFFVATLLNKKFAGRAAARSILFLPVVLTTGVIAALESSDLLVNSLKDMSANAMTMSAMKSAEIIDYFDIASLLSSIGMPSVITSFVKTSVDNIYTIVVSSGVQIVIFLAGLQSISPSIYESASVEGAVGWEAFWKITFPMVKPMILVNTIYTVIDFLVKSTNVVMKQVQDVALQQMDYGLSAAMAWLYFIPILILIAVVGLIMSRKTFYYN
ncbi:hypothetical protein SDC9_149306 [bioreactor metagenome]|uniref:ABC transmembrane type-1 domain-containing protein n=1 Tax=bioreactor metagenome TaxID=1076179 RepID=A0A645ENH1_9ZZZZ